MTIIDTHCHLYLEQFDEDREATMERAIEAGVQRFYLPNIDSTTLDSMQRMMEDRPERCFGMMGLHPCSVKKDHKKELDLVEKELASGKYVAVGEVGIDLYWDKSTLKEQVEVFSKQVEWAKELGLPIVIHARDAFEEIFSIIDKLNDERLFGIFHCFTGGSKEAERIIGYGGFKMGIGGVVTFKNGGLDKTLQKVELAHLVLETDSPYIAPAPFRGKRNEPAYLRQIVDKLAEVYGTSVEEIAKMTTNNALKIFER